MWKNPGEKNGEKSEAKNTPERQEIDLVGNPDLVTDICGLIEPLRRVVAVVVNAGLTVLYLRIGKRIGEDALQGERTEYGAGIVVSLSPRSNWNPYIQWVERWVGAG